jgi:hypothetical protein
LLVSASDSIDDSDVIGIAALEAFDALNVADDANDEEDDTLPNYPYRAHDADFSLVAADGLVFRVHKYQLMAAR